MNEETYSGNEYVTSMTYLKKQTTPISGAVSRWIPHFSEPALDEEYETPKNVSHNLHVNPSLLT